MKKLLSGILLITSVLFLTDCSKKKDIIVPIPSATATVDGTSKTVVPGIGILAFETELGHEGRAMSLTFVVGDDTLTVQVSNWDFQSPPDNGIKVKTYTNELGNSATSECLTLGDGINTLCEGILVSYLSNGQLYTSIFYDGDYAGNVKITECDVPQKTVSGSYDIKIKSTSSADVLMKGTFTNIKYIVNK